MATDIEKAMAVLRRTRAENPPPVLLNQIDILEGMLLNAQGRHEEALLAMRDGVAPPTINVDEPDPECDLDYIPYTARKMDIEYAVANCIAFGSKNSAVVLRKL